ncbi:PfaD family polyunsaturated fatty acid/polyketide biosynthesis protein [Anabaena minutissima FACHB-250]|nr:PfaD family polyunsaturated fatty acid/polyketide biosynthesis protein [Anabaena minutissima FACHB-250]
MIVTNNSPKHYHNPLRTINTFDSKNQVWRGSLDTLAFDEIGIQSKLLNLQKPCYIVRIKEKIGVSNDGYWSDSNNSKTEEIELLIAVPALISQQLGDPNFLRFHNVKYAYTAGAMAHGIASEELVIALGKEGILSSFGAGGLAPARVETAIKRIQQALPQGPYAFNLLHSPSEPAIERRVVDLYLKYQARTIEASAFLDLTENIVYYRAAGLSLNSVNQIAINNKVIAKISRREVATKFLQPAPTKILKQLVQQGLISELQANLAEKVPVADDVTVEADSGGHTDNRPLVCLLSSILELRDNIQSKYGYEQPVRIGAGGGIATPQSALAAFMMGAGYVVTGSINQSCIEAGTSQHTKQLLAQAEMADVMMAPAADMFEMGVKVQVLKRGTFFPLRAQKLFDLYKSYESIEDIPLAERDKLEKQVFQKSLDAVWQETVAYLSQRNPVKLAQASNNPKLKMALIFRWYLGLSSRWSNSGEPGREMDYQIWCGPAMGSFNDWVRGSYLEVSNNRKVVDVAHHIMTGAAFLYRIQSLKFQGLQMPDNYSQYFPSEMKV